ncbi:MAG TPA: ABC transporter ATP-binding protein [Nitrososphaerales archaeon]|nr:ABC transporter ATP-binding protein [Nitrososphaerales archaeon]
MQTNLRSLDVALDSSPAVEMSKVTKQFDSQNVLCGIDLKVMSGEIYGLLGPNGAGKTTIIKTIAGITEPTSGSVRVLGLDSRTQSTAIKSRIGYVPETSILYDSLSPRDFFEFVGSIRGMDASSANEKIARLTEAFGLSEYFDSPIATLSLGTRQKISIIASLMHEPRLLLLDEPLNGLDSRSSRIVKDLISIHARKRSGAVLFSTHIMEIAERICDRIGIIYNGKLVAEGTFQELRRKAREISANLDESRATLEEVFLKLTNEEAEIAETVRILRETFVATR